MPATIYATSFDSADAAAAAAFWAAVLGRAVSPGASRESAALTVREGTSDQRILFHGVPEPKTVKNRLHLDLVTDDFDAELTRLRALGATEIATFPGWTTLADPEGNELDLVRG